MYEEVRLINSLDKMQFHVGLWGGPSTLKISSRRPVTPVSAGLKLGVGHCVTEGRGNPPLEEEEKNAHTHVKLE